MLHCLRRTPVSSTWLVERGEERAVLRLDSPGAGALGLDRDREWQALQLASAAGLAPQPLARDGANGILLRAFLPGDACVIETLRQPGCLAELGRLLRRVHALPLAGPPLDGEEAIARYAALGGARVEAQAREARADLLVALAHGTPFCQCHNDPVAGNLVAGAGDGALRLIDWEYTAPYDPWFDLAAVVAHHDLAAEEAGTLLAAYLGQPPHPGQRRRLEDWKRFYRALAGLWSHAVAAVARGNDDESR